MPTWNTWRGMVSRCGNPNATNYRYYGALGVSVCPRWRSFEAFLEDMGERPEGCTLDRADPYGDYEPGNCRWATQAEQVANRRAHPRDVKITAATAFAIRLARATTGLSQREIAEIHGVSQANVSLIIRNRIWRKAWLAIPS